MEEEDFSFSHFCSPYLSQLTSLHKSSLRTDQNLVELAMIVVLQLVFKIAAEKRVLLLFKKMQYLLCYVMADIFLHPEIIC